MCDCEAPQVCSTMERKARTSHQCCECGEAISSGERYEYTSGVWDNRGASFKTCRRCAGVRNWFVGECLPSYDCAPCFGALWDDATDFGNEGTKEEIAQAAASAGYL